MSITISQKFGHREVPSEDGFVKREPDGSAVFTVTITDQRGSEMDRAAGGIMRAAIVAIHALGVHVELPAVLADAEQKASGS